MLIVGLVIALDTLVTGARAITGRLPWTTDHHLLIVTFFVSLLALAGPGVVAGRWIIDKMF